MAEKVEALREESPQSNVANPQDSLP